MNINELTVIIKHIKKTSPCPSCKKLYNIQDISILASTKHECLLEMRCKYCKKTSLSDIVATPINRKSKSPQDTEVPLINQVIRNGITNDDILDTKNFLNKFDGNFKKLFFK